MEVIDKPEEDEGIEIPVNKLGSMIIETDEELAQKQQNRAIKRRIYKNLIVFSISFLFYSSSQSGLHSLQAALNSQTKGTLSLLSSSAASSLSSFFLPIIGFKLLGFKWTAIVAQFISISYIVANYYPCYSTLIPASIIHGLSNVTLWILHSSLVSALAKQYSNYSTRRPELILVKFFAIASLISHQSHIVSSAVSAFVLNQNMIFGKHETVGHLNSSIINHISVVSHKVCGAFSCPSTGSDIEKPPRHEILQMVITYAVLSLIGIFVLLVFMDNIKPTQEDLGSIKDSLKKSLQLMKNIKLWILFPLFLLIGSLMTYLSMDFTRYFIACGYGVSTVGIFTFIVGISITVSLILIHQLAKLLNTTVMIILVVLSLIGVMIYLLFWEYHTSVYVVYGLGAYFGFIESTWSTILHAIIGVVFYEQQTSAYANFRFIVSTFLLIMLAASIYICSYVKVYLILVLAALSFCSPIVLELYLMFEKRREQKKNIIEQQSKVDTFLAKFFK